MSSALPSGHPSVNQDITPPPHGYYAIAHRAGNNLHHLEEALSAGVDAIECDFWHDRGRLSLRHERKLPALPVLFDRWYLRFSFGDELNLPDLLREINFRAELFLDVKSSTTLAADAVLALYHDHEAMMPVTSVTSREWSLLDRVAQAETRLQTFYSIGRKAGIDALLRRTDGQVRPTGTSIRHTLVNVEVVRRLHDAGLLVYAWTVNNRHRATDLLSWGVDGIISDDTELFAKIGAR